MIKATKAESLNDFTRLERSPQGMAAWQNAQRYLIEGRHGPAMTSYRNLTQQFPGVSQLWAEFSIAAAGDLDFALANQAVKQAAELGSGDAALLVSLGQQNNRLRRQEEAGKCYQRAVEAEPSSIHARLSLAAWFERNHRLDQALECTQACLEKNPNDPRILYFKAFLQHRKGLDNEAEPTLRNLLQRSSMEPDVKVSATHLLGVVLDALGQYAEALIWIEKAKTQRRQLMDPATLERIHTQMERARQELLASLTPEAVRRWREEAAGAPGPHPLVFLGGSPRSGVTLVEQILGAHSDIFVFDEPEAFAQEVMTGLHPNPPARCLNFKSLNTLAPNTSARLVDRYFKSLLREVDQAPDGKLLVDKNPALTPSLHVWLKLFAKLKVVVTVRDPRDVVLSCYFQNLPATSTNVNFLGLDGTAKFYADCMDEWLKLRELGGFDWMETRYEEVVGNLSGEGQKLMNFLGLPWQESQANFYEPKRRNFILAAAYDDVTKPLYNKSVARWKNYAGALAPLQKRLEPYCKAFGYQ